MLRVSGRCALLCVRLCGVAVVCVWGRPGQAWSVYTSCPLEFVGCAPCVHGFGIARVELVYVGCV